MVLLFFFFLQITLICKLTIQHDLRPFVLILKRCDQIHDQIPIFVLCIMDNRHIQILFWKKIIFISFHLIRRKINGFEEITFLFIAYYLCDILLCCETKQIFNMVDWMNVWMDVIFLENIQKRAYGEKFVFFLFYSKTYKILYWVSVLMVLVFRFYLSYNMKRGTIDFSFILHINVI